MNNEKKRRRHLIINLFLIIFLSVGIATIFIVFTSENYKLYGNKYDGFGREAYIDENNKIIQKLINNE